MGQEIESRRINSHETEYHWHLYDASDIRKAMCSNGLTSKEFALKDTDDCTCRILLDMTKDDPATIMFSSMEEIHEIGVAFSVMDFKSCQHIYIAPFTEKTFSHALDKSIDENNDEDGVFFDTNSAADALTIIVKISLVTNKGFTAPIDPRLENPSRRQRITSTGDYFTRVLRMFRALMEINASAETAGLRATDDAIYEELFKAAMIEEQEEYAIMITYDAWEIAFETFLVQLLTTDPTDSDRIVEALMLLAHQHRVEKLKYLCGVYMVATISVRNVVQFFSIADRLNLPELKTAALLVFRANRSLFETRLNQQS